MSYAPYLRNTSGIVFFGEQGSQQTFYSDTNFLIQDGAAGYIRSPNLIIGDGGDIGSVSDPDAISIASNGNVTMSQSLSVVGDLTVNGTTTTVDSTIVTIEDPVVIIGAQAGDNPYGSTADDNKDRGIAFYWNESGPKIGFFGHDDSIRGFTYIPSGTFDAASGVITGPVGWGVFHAISGDLVGNVTGSADTLTTTRTFSITGEGTASAQNFNGSQNVTLTFGLDETAISNQTTKGTAAVAGDILLILDSEDSNNFKQITRSNFISGLGGFSSFDVTDSGGVARQVDDGETVKFINGISVTFQVTSDGTTHEVSGRLVDGGTTENHLATSVAGNGLTGGGGSALAVGAGSLIDVTADAVDVDLTEAAAATIADGDYLIFLDGGTAGAASKGDTSDLATLLGGNGLNVTDSTLSVNAGNGLVLNGNAVDVDLSEFSAGVVNSGDKFAVLHVDGTTEELITISELGSWLAGDNITVSGDGRLSAQAAGMTSFDITGDTGTETVQNGETVTFAGAAGLDVTVTATNTVTYTIDISEYGTAAVGAGDSFLMLDNDGTTEQRSTVDQLGTYLAGTNITNTAGVLSVPDATIDGVVFEAANFVDGTTIDFTVTAGTSVTAEVIDGTITEAKRSRSVVTDSATSTLASTDDVSLVNAAGGAVTITLTGVATSGKRVTIKKTDSTGNTVTIQRDGSSTIDGATTKILYSQYESITIISDGTNWHII